MENETLFVEAQELLGILQVQRAKLCEIADAVQRKPGQECKGETSPAPGMLPLVMAVEESLGEARRIAATIESICGQMLPAEPPAAAARTGHAVGPVRQA